MKRKICVVTGSRAEYGLLKPLIKAIKKDMSLKLQLIVTGMHLSPEFGLTYKEIEKDGFTIDEKIDIRLSSDTPVGIAKSMGIALAAFARSYERLMPDIVVILGDRFEIFSAAQAAYIQRIPIAHISGGEITEGALDDAFRHSITKMSHLHFTSTEEYRKRVIQLGESPGRVFNVGALGLEDIGKLKLLPRNVIEKDLNFKFNKRNLLVTFHPVTLEGNSSRQQFKNLLDALDKLEETNFIFTKSNADAYGRIINRMIDGYVAKNPLRCASFNSLGRLKYLSAMRFMDGVVGNSSSGITEAPSFKIGTVNIGDRQKGRIKAISIIDCAPRRRVIRQAINKLCSKKFKSSLKNVSNPYEGRNTAKKIKNILRTYDLTNIVIVKKRFYNVDFKYRG